QLRSIGEVTKVTMLEIRAMDPGGRSRLADPGNEVAPIGADGMRISFPNDAECRIAVALASLPARDSGGDRAGTRPQCDGAPDAQGAEHQGPAGGVRYLRQKCHDRTQDRDRVDDAPWTPEPRAQVGRDSAAHDELGGEGGDKNPLDDRQHSIDI